MQLMSRLFGFVLHLQIMESRRFHFGHWDVCDDHHVVVVVVVGLNVLYVLLDDDYCGVGLQITVNNETLYVLITSDTDVLVRCR